MTGGMKKLVFGATALIVVIGGYVGWRAYKNGDGPAYKFAQVERGRIVASVSASGTLNPVTSVSVGSQISGQLKDVLVDFNTEVKAGQLIARIDPQTFEYRVRQAQADVDAARASTLVQQALVNQVEVNLADAKRTVERNEDLVRRNFISDAELDKSRAAYNALAAQLRSVQAQAANADANVKQREAALAQARIDLERTEIRSPVSGVVVKRAVDAGQTVAASLQAPELFIIARDLKDMQVDVAIDEADVGRIRTGQKASFTVDAYPGRQFEGEVRQTRKAAQTVQNVVTYTVVVSAPNPDLALLPGMTANVRIVTDARDDVLKLPSAALRFRLPGEAGGAATGAAANGGAASGAGSAGAAGGQLRERLVKELALDETQQAKLDAALAALRPKFQQVRELPEAERRRAFERVRADLDAQIETFLTPGQKTRLAALAAEGAARRGSTGSGRVYVLEGGKPKQIQVRTGLTDGTSTEVLANELKEGDQVIVGAQTAPAAKATTSAPRMMF